MIDLMSLMRPEPQNWQWQSDCTSTSSSCCSTSGNSYPNLWIRNNRKNPKVCFFPKMSTGTIGVRVDKVLNHGLYYCEFKTSRRLYGSSVMFGLSTFHAKLRSNQYIDLLGDNDQSCGLSHRGYTYNNYEIKKYMRPLPENRAAIIGLLFDGNLGTLSYYCNGQSLGVAFTGLDRFTYDLFPTISSTASGIQISIVKCLRGLFPLEYLCYGSIVRWMLKERRENDQKRYRDRDRDRDRDDRLGNCNFIQPQQQQQQQLFLPALLNQNLINLLKLLTRQ